MLDFAYCPRAGSRQGLLGYRVPTIQSKTNGHDDIAWWRICNAIVLHLRKCENHRHILTMDSKWTDQRFRPPSYHAGNYDDAYQLLAAIL
jgi:hypothetical protein